MVTLVVNRASAYDIQPEEREKAYQMCTKHGFPPIFYWHTLLLWARCRHCFQKECRFETGLYLCLALVLSFHGHPRPSSLEPPLRHELSRALRGILPSKWPRPNLRNTMWSLFLHVLGGRLR